MKERFIVLMQSAIQVAETGIAAGQSPFGAVVATSDGRPVCGAHNQVRATCDPTAHAEIVAIRRACEKLGTIDLSGHVLATTCEPCPMCASAIHWARFDAVVCGAGIATAAAAGFNELRLAVEAIYSQGHSNVKVHRGVLRHECETLFETWKQGPYPFPY